MIDAPRFEETLKALANDAFEEKVNDLATRMLEIIGEESSTTKMRVIEVVLGTIAFSTIKSSSERRHADPYFVVDEIHRQARRLIKNGSRR